MLLDDGTTFKLPGAAGGVHNSMEVDLAFARFADGHSNGDGDQVYSNFYLPIAKAHPEDNDVRHRILNAKDVTFGDKRFSHFVGAKRQ